ncbi:MAG: chloride channel protein [Myxococcales bacterium]|nr:chloride channel protein [Myxococcales bacterium]
MGSARSRITFHFHGVVLGAAVGILCGISAALFLWLLDLATSWREGHEVIVWALPIAGLAIGYGYERFGQPIKGGSNLVIATAQGGGEGAPLPQRLAPMVLLGTVLTHLFGGSAGREGTAVQMGAGLSDWLARRVRVDAAMRRQLLLAGMAGGFGAVFGTPLAGTVFGLEVLARRPIRYDALLPSLAAAFVGDFVTRGVGIAHTPFRAVSFVAPTPMLVVKWVLFAIVIAAVALVFIELTHFIRRRGERHVPRLPWRMALGGLAIVGLWQLVGSSDYLGLSVPLMLRAFSDGELPAYVFALKLLFTAITLGAGFLGGEVTPLFVIGATLGCVMASALGMPIELGAGVGMAALFAAAANTPLALSVMAMELLGVAIAPHALIVCVLAWVLVGPRSIYAAQLTLNSTQSMRDSRLDPLRR